MTEPTKANLKIWIAPNLHQDKYPDVGYDWKVMHYPTYGPHGEAWDESDWQKSFDIFEDRIIGRFINYVNIIRKHEKENKDYHAGFVILALDCLLIETLQQFYDGRDSSQGSERAFETFLTSSPLFNDESYFGVDKSEGGLADLFYDQIRCGILHQAEVKTDSRVVARGELIKPEGKGIVVNRVMFHNQLKKEFNAYLRRLREPQAQEDNRLREMFRQKNRLYLQSKVTSRINFLFCLWFEHENRSDDLSSSFSQSGWSSDITKKTCCFQ